MGATGPTVPRKRLGQELQALRRRMNLTGEQVAKRMEWAHSSKLYRVENGQSGINQKELRELLEFYGVTDPTEREELLALGTAGKQRGWWAPYARTIAAPYSTYVGMESEAAELRCYEAQVVHGLLQTEEYARAVISSGTPNESRAAVAKKVQLRLERQLLLTRATEPVRMKVVFDESVLRRRIGGPEVMRRQLLHLMHLGESPNVTVRVIPHAAGAHPGMLSSFTVITFRNPKDPDVVYVEGLTGDVFPAPADVPRYKVAFDTLSAVALAAAASIVLIEAALAEYDAD